jgi:phosphoribosylamine--glycine ligase
VTGVEVAVGAFFNGKEFIYPLNVNFEHKKLFPGNIGPSRGEMGTAMFWSGPNKLFNSTLKKMEAKLASEGYVGYIDLNCIVNGNGIYPLEFTARFGYPTISIQQGGHDYADWPVPRGSRRRREPEAQGEERLPDRRADRRFAVSVRR